MRSLLLALVLFGGPSFSQELPPKEAGTDVPRPKAVKLVKPQYPAEAAAQGQRGIVILELIIDESGKVSSAQIVRSVPAFDEAALSAARQWEYEVTKVNGQPVKVKLTVPITFSMKLPEMSRQEGIPELRQGAVPAAPPGSPARAATVVADVTLGPDGRVADAQVTSGESPWADALLQALRTWRFSPSEEGVTVSFRVRAEFAQPGRDGTANVALRLDGLRRSESPVAEPTAAPAPAPAAVAALPSPPPSPSAAPAPAPAASATPAPVVPQPAAQTPAPPPLAQPSPSAASQPPAAPPSPGPASPAPASPAAPPPAARPLAPATASPSRPAAKPGGEPSPNPGRAASPQAPPVEVIRSPGAVPVPTAPTVATSAVRDVTLAAGVPDLTKGRHPIVPPLARMAGAGGTVVVRFAVDAAGISSVQDVTGAEILKEAARQTVVSWVFRRVTADRLFLIAELAYRGDAASAAVKLAE